MVMVVHGRLSFRCERWKVSSAIWIYGTTWLTLEVVEFSVAYLAVLRCPTKAWVKFNCCLTWSITLKPSLTRVDKRGDYNIKKLFWYVPGVWVLISFFLDANAGVAGNTQGTIILIHLSTYFATSILLCLSYTFQRQNCNRNCCLWSRILTDLIKTFTK